MPSNTYQHRSKPQFLDWRKQHCPTGGRFTKPELAARISQDLGIHVDPKELRIHQFGTIFVQAIMMDLQDPDKDVFCLPPVR